MSLPATNNFPDPDVIAAAREFICRDGHGDVVFCDALLEELGARFGDRFRVSPDMHKLLHLIEELWDDPCIRRPDDDWGQLRMGRRGFGQVPLTRYEDASALVVY
jgi:hypothetical protein